MRVLGLVLVGLALLLVGCNGAPSGVASPSAASAPALQSPVGSGPGAAAAVAQPATATAAPVGGAPTPTATVATPTAAVRVTSTPSAATAPAGPLLALTAPAEQTTEVPSGTRSVVVAGRSRPDAVVSVNGELAMVDPTGAFRVEVPLDEEITLVEVVASDAAGREVREQRVIVRE